MTDVLRQGDPRWAKDKVGKSSSTIGAVGCLLTCYAQALRDLGVDAEATPASVNAVAVLKGAAMLQQPTAAALGLAADDVTRSTDVHKDMIEVLRAALAGAAVVVMHVDHDSALAKGDVDGDHFVLARRQEGDDVVFADPATGKEHRLSLVTRSATVGSREYLLRSVRPLRRK